VEITHNAWEKKGTTTVPTTVDPSTARWEDKKLWASTLFGAKTLEKDYGVLRTSTKRPLRGRGQQLGERRKGEDRQTVWKPDTTSRVVLTKTMGAGKKSIQEGRRDSFLARGKKTKNSAKNEKAVRRRRFSSVKKQIAHRSRDTRKRTGNEKIKTCEGRPHPLRRLTTICCLTPRTAPSAARPKPRAKNPPNC